MIRIPSRRELLLGLGVATLASTFVLIPGPAVADATCFAWDCGVSAFCGRGSTA